MSQDQAVSELIPSKDQTLPKIARLKDQTLPELAVTMAILSDAAYSDDNSKIFADLGLDRYKFIHKDGAEGHLAASDTELVITFRGTETKELNDIIASFNAIPKRHGSGLVHKGFRTEGRKLIDQVFDWIKTYPGRDIYLTGHSLGGGIALYIAQELEFAGNTVTKILTFGQPRVGNQEYIDNIKAEHYRFVNCNDLVAHFPPSYAMGFRHHGVMCYINFYGNIRPLTNYQRFKDMIRGRWKALTKFQLFDDLRDHMMDGYISKLTKIRDSGESF
jgi:triacylglycerol lipase